MLNSRLEIDTECMCVRCQSCRSRSAGGFESRDRPCRKDGRSQCVAIVDRGGNLLVFERMEGAKLLSQHSAIQKAITAASHRTATGNLPTDLGIGIALATGGRYAPIAGDCPLKLMAKL